jgi:exopolysaccharide production protein ExoY
MNVQEHQALNAKFLFKPKMVRIPTWKRAIDLALCLLALPLFCLISAVMVVVIRLTSPGPLLFTQERVGYRGSRFKCHQAHVDRLLSSNTAMVKLDEKGDSRMIPGGWLLRATGLDELPQIINVFRGDMCFVGPRPCLPYEFERYEPWQRERFNSMPGLTGLWQVSGKNRTTFDEMIRLDVSYSQTRTPSLDLWIISMTLPALLVQVSDTLRARRSRAQDSTVPASLASKSNLQEAVR